MYATAVYSDKAHNYLHAGYMVIYCIMPWHILTILLAGRAQVPAEPITATVNSTSNHLHISIEVMYVTYAH